MQKQESVTTTFLHELQSEVLILITQTDVNL